MRRKDGKKKRTARRTKPIFSHGLKEDKSFVQSKDPKWDIVSMFSGCGGLDLGFMGGFKCLGSSYGENPFKISAAYDFLEDAVESYKLNLGDECEMLDLSTASPEDMPPADILMGGFPCQDFSSSGPKVGISGKRGSLYTALLRYMNHHKPRIVVGENVPYLAKLQQGVYLEKILNDFEGAGYRFQVWNLYGPEYGLPQSRRRLFLVGVREDLEGMPMPPKPTHVDDYLTIDKAISDLEKIHDEAVPNQSQFFVASRASSGGGQGDHNNQYGKVSYCIRANSRGRIQFHYKLDRRLTVRECARVQSFPDEFVFPFSTQRNLTLIGNAVPPLLGNKVARQILQYLDEPSDEWSNPFRAHMKSNIVVRSNPEPNLPFVAEAKQ